MSTPLVNPTVQGLIEAIRDLLSQPDPNNSNWSDGELLRYINEAVRLLMAELSDIDEGHFAADPVLLPLVSGEEAVDLPSDCFKVRALYKNVSQGRVMLSYRNNLNEGYSIQGGSGSDTYSPYYYFRGNSVVLRPVPQLSEPVSGLSVGTAIQGLTLEYIQFPESLINGSDQLTVQIAPLFRQVVESYAVYKAKFKESLVVGVNTYATAASHFADLFKQFRDLNQIRSKNPTAIVPWNP